MYPGWNLGNTMEATGGETSWQPTTTTQAVIDAVKAAGFKSVRIPCSWDIHSTGGTIDADWMARVKQIVDYCIRDGLYVVLNDHWDNGWIEVLGFSKSSSSYQPVDEATITAKATRLKELWTQIANAFRDYDEHLLFAGLNEPFQENNLFSSRHEELTPILIRYNKAFVEAVRATGGNNAQRTLVVQGPSTSISSTCSYMPADKLPEAAGRLMVEVHYYDPGQFCGTYDASGDNAFYYWGAANHGTNHNPTYGEESYLDGMFANLKNTFTSKGYPVIIGEYAALQRTLPNDDQTKHNNSVKYYYQYLNQTAVNCGIVPFAWDTNDISGLGKESGSNTIIDRAKCAVLGHPAMDGITAGAAAGSWPY
jgi:endoglucanase